MRRAASKKMSGSGLWFTPSLRSTITSVIHWLGASLYFLSNYHNAGGMIVEDGNCALDFTSQSRNRDMSWARWNLNRSKL